MVRHPTFAFLLAALLLAALVSSCSSPPTTEPAVTSTPPAAQETLEETGPTEESAGLSIITPTPRPTAVPGVITDLVDALTAAAGVDEAVILGLTTQDWINLGISVLIALFGFFVASPLVVRLLGQFVRRTPIQINEALFTKLKPQIRWLVGVLFLQFATHRLVFVSLELKIFLGNVYFLIYLIIILSGLWIIVDDAIERYIRELSPEKDDQRLQPLLPLLHRVAHIVLLVLGAQVLLSRFGIELGAMATALGLGGLAISLAAQDVLSDLIAGFIILISQPFRVGDRIEIQELGTWGDVVDIGARTTNIRTLDNRMVIVPNSIIGKSQVVNYTYPDPQYRVQMEIGIAYGTDIERARRIIVDTVRQVDGVLQDKPVDALYNAMGDSAMTFRVRWWLGSYVDTRHVFDRVNTALQIAIDEAGIEMPFPTQDLNIRIDPGQAGDEKLS